MPRPCPTCPYRTDVPSGLWAREEYEKLRRYDTATIEQPPAVFTCHQKDREAAGRRVCAGWAGCHDGDNLLALRIAAVSGVMSAADVQAVIDYVSPVDLFASGSEAADHGRAEISDPSPRAAVAIAKIVRVRGDLR
ncbi:MAG: DUF6283 family protein [Micromonosporaceae bacterium]